MRSSAIVRLYPRSWQARYGDEMRAVLESGPLSRTDLLDLGRGALDAWLHPATPSRVPAAAALTGGGLWTVVAAGVVFQPAPLDWPGYLAETIGLAIVAAGVLLVATLGCALRLGDTGGRTLALAAGVTILGYAAWLVALAAAGAGVADGPTLAAAQTLAMIGSGGRRPQPGGLRRRGDRPAHPARLSRDAHPVGPDLARVRGRVDGDRDGAAGRGSAPPGDALGRVLTPA